MPSFSPRPSHYGVDTSVPPDERYRIVGRIAQGGMAEIYLARMMSNAGVEREVVLKRLLPELQGDHEFVQMFHDEAQIASQLSHPNIVQIFELGELDGSLFISMELLRGVNIRDLLARLHHDNRRMPPELAVRICAGALEALDYAHSFADASGRPLNVVHRDVSPQNIIVTYEGTVKLVDFGVAKAEGKLHQTRAGLVKGKFAYMSPEQIGGGAIDGRSDIFAVAEVFFELMLHRHPFFAESDMDVLRAILDSVPTHPCAIDQNFPPGLGDILMKAMKKDTAERYTDAAAMGDALEHFLLENRTPATSISLGRYVRKLFDDRIQVEQRARETGNDDMLIESMTVGRAERNQMSGMSQPPPEIDPSPVIEPTDYDEDEEEDATLAGGDDYRVEPSSQMVVHGGGADPAGDPTYDAYDEAAEGANPKIQSGEFQDEIHDLFGAEGPGGGGQLVGEHETMPPDDEDAAEMPTMLGQMSPEQMAEIRSAAEGMRKRSKPKVSVGPASNRAGPTITRSKGPADPAERKPPPEPYRPPAQQPVLTPVSVPQPATSQPPVTTRSETVLKGEGSTKTGKDRWGVWFFIAGLGALVGAVVFAVVQLRGPTRPVMQLVVQSEPAGAKIFLDNGETGAHTPTTFPQITSDKPHVIRLELQGYATFQKSIDPSPDLAGEPYIIHEILEKLPEGAGGSSP